MSKVQSGKIPRPVNLAEAGIASKFERKRELNLYFSLDTILKKYLNGAYRSIREYRHINAVENYEFRVLSFNKGTQTYKHYFQPSHAMVQTDSTEVFDSTSVKLNNLGTLIENKLTLSLKSVLLAIYIESQNNDIQKIECEINEKQRKINRKLEWANINERKKLDAQTKFFLTFMGGFFSRKKEESVFEAFDCIEKANFDSKLKRIALNNVVTLALRVVRVEFDRFRKYAMEEKEQLKYDHATILKGLLFLKISVQGMVEKSLKTTFCKIRLECRPRSRRSIINMSRPSATTERDDRSKINKRSLT
jgi:hypothetical protein